MPTQTRAAVDLRAARAAVFALVCVALSAAGHVMASGRAVPLWALTAAWAAVFACAMALAGRERSMPGITACLLGGQLLLHTLFGMGQSSMGRSSMDRSPMGGHGHRVSELEALAGRLLCGVSGGGTGQSAPRGGDAVRIVRDAGIDPHAYTGTVPSGTLPSGTLCSTLSSASPMLLGHVLAALAAGWFLRRGEAALWRLVRLTARAAQVSAFPLRAALALVRALVNGLLGAVTSRRRVPCATEPPEGAAVLLQHSVVRRGPPAYALAA